MDYTDGASVTNQALRLTLHNNLDELGRLASELETFCALHGLGPKVLNALNLALEEVVTNVISYGFDDGEVHDIAVSLEMRGGELTASVEDDGAAFDPLSKADPDVEASIDDRRIGGLGVLLVKRLMDDVTYARIDGRNVLSMRKRLSASDAVV